ncbi:MAG: alpha/beta fold hydrolase [Candidatus Moranbacteria bacterium]|nr:alpha/beta fold hydrolase [Candidatus Moranbacteria bacterium]
MHMKTIIINNLKTNYLQSSSFQAHGCKVFLHGWQSQAQHLSSILLMTDNYIALDLPGFGGSEQPTHAWSLAQYVDFLYTFFQALNIEEPILVGHSFGGALALKYCSDYKDCQQAVLIAPAGIRKKGLKVSIYWVIAKIFKFLLKLSLIEVFRNQIRKMLYRLIDSRDYLESGSMKAIYQKVIRADLSQALAGIDIEVHLIWGRQDREYPLKYGLQMQALLEKSQLHVIDQAGHFPWLDQPKKFKQIFTKLISYDHQKFNSYSPK